MKTKFLLVALALSAGTAFGQVQTQVGVPPTLEVQRIAPQLVAFAGSEVNFANLVNGLSLGLPVTLTTPLGAGVTQVVTFTPVGSMSALQVAQTLETARQALISRGVGAPTAQQIGVTLVGGTLPTSIGNTQVAALVNSNTTLGTSAVTQPSVAATLQSQNTSAAGGSVRNMSDSPFGRGISDSPVLPVPGVTNGTATTQFATPTAPQVNSPFIPAPTTGTGTTPNANPFGGRFQPR